MSGTLWDKEDGGSGWKKAVTPNATYNKGKKKQNRNTDGFMKERFSFLRNTLRLWLKSPD